MGREGESRLAEPQGTIWQMNMAGAVSHLESSLRQAPIFP